MEICSICECIIAGEPLYCNECDSLHCSHCFTPGYPFESDEMTVTFKKEPVVE